MLTGDDDSKQYLLTAADSYALHANQSGTPDDSAFADTHSLDQQRAVNFLCYVYGSDEKTFRCLVDQQSMLSLTNGNIDCCLIDSANGGVPVRRIVNDDSA
ncbi:DUF4344 domain-containing metallopeptidase [Mycobacteroides chelonae]|uniref:DUF4344 domain-containing metallopeptidase n=1 Tax=Mycobacteroides chelonae TaxID=1774 RepID=UPI0009BD689F